MNFNISLIDNNKLIAGCSSLDKNVSDFACENDLSGLEFLSCIPGSVGGGIRMNSGCFGSEFKDFLVSISVLLLCASHYGPLFRTKAGNVWCAHCE